MGFIEMPQQYIYGKRIGIELCDPNNLNEHLILRCGNELVEPVLTILDTQKDDWRFVCTKSGLNGVEVVTLPSAEIASMDRYCQPHESKDPIQPKLAKLDDIVVNAINYQISRARHIPLGDDIPDAVMIISNDDPKVNNARSRVAVKLWQIVAEVSKQTDRPLPRLICNGYDWNVQLMREVAQEANIPETVIDNVILQHPAYTQDHGKKMLVQLDSPPKSLVFVSSSEHLARVKIHSRTGLASGYTNSCL